jgi:ornithine decarboxylase
MSETLPAFSSVSELLNRTRPHRPVYCLHPDIYRATANEFVAKFPGRVLYAVKANDHPEVLRLLHEGGVRHFDCASLNEIEIVKNVCPEARCYFMTPVRLRGAARVAQEKYGVRHFVLDHESGLDSLISEIDVQSSVIFARMAVHHPSAMQDLSVRFGAPPEDIGTLLNTIAGTGAEAALAFNVGSNVSDPAAYRYAIGVAGSVLQQLSTKVRLVDIGGGFPVSYPGFAAPPMSEYIDAAGSARTELPLTEDAEILAEPGRALAAAGMSAVVEVLLRKEQRVFMNDGMYGVFWELRFKGHDRFEVRCFRDGMPLDGPLISFQLFGPTCDSTDSLPGEVELPESIRAGDYLEFSSVGAYSLAGRTNFNGHYSENIVTIGADTPRQNA